MAKISTDQPLVPSVLDRLLDFDRSAREEPPKSQVQVLAELRESVRRDLTDMLNTHARCRSWPEELAELDRSILSTGIPDAGTADLAREQGRRDLARSIERTIRQFEPRFKTVKVVLLENADALDRTLRFRIEALLHAYPAPEPIAFDSALQPITGNYSVKSSSR